MGLALLGNQLSAEQAHEWGMIWQVVDDETLADTRNSWHGIWRHNRHLVLDLSSKR